MSKPPLTVRTIAAATGLAMLAACATPPPPPAPPPPPPPPPPVVEAIPYRPVPPALAAYHMDIPRKDTAGVRTTINTMLGEDETVWHFRAGWNVAALNCTRDIHQPILDTYAVMLRAESRELAGANDRIERFYRDRANGNRRNAIRLRETHSTELYNYFALPSARREFCNVALAVANEYLANPPEDFELFARNGLQRYEIAFERFYSAYEAYETASAEWDARYGSRYGASQPGWVALYGTAAQQQAAGVMNFGALPANPVVVPDTETGAEIPVIPVDGQNSGTPVVQPIPDETVVLPPVSAGEGAAPL